MRGLYCAYYKNKKHIRQYKIPLQNAKSSPATYLGVLVVSVALVVAGVVVRVVRQRHTRWWRWGVVRVVSLWVMLRHRLLLTLSVRLLVLLLRLLTVLLRWLLPLLLALLKLKLCTLLSCMGWRLG